MSTQLSYDDLKHEFIQELKKYTIGVLATSHGNLVTARSMMLLSEKSELIRVQLIAFNSFYLIILASFSVSGDTVHVTYESYDERGDVHTSQGVFERVA